MTNDEFRKVLDDQSAVSERMHKETGAPLVTVPRPGGMQPNKPAERPDVHSVRATPHQQCIAALKAVEGSKREAR